MRAKTLLVPIADGDRREDLPVTPIVREDLRGLPLQVGPFHSMYSDAAGRVEHDDFRPWIRKAAIR